MQYKKIEENPKERWKVIAHLIMQHKCKRIAEIGFSRGDNARAIKKNLHSNEYKLKEFYLIDIPKKKQIEFYGKDSANKFYHNMSGLESCQYFDVGSVKASELVAKSSLDFIFMDGDTSSYEAVKRDIMLWVPKLSQKGIMAGRYFYLTPEESFCKTHYIKEVVDHLFGQNDISLHKLVEKNSGKPDYMWWFKSE